MYMYMYVYMYIYICIYVYISVVTGLAKILDISDLGFFRPSIVYECASHAAHNGPGDRNLRQLLPSRIADFRIKSGLLSGLS